MNVKTQTFFYKASLSFVAILFLWWLPASLVYLFITMLPSARFALALVIAIACGLSIFIVLHIFDVLDKRRRRRLLGIFFALCGVAIVIYNVDRVLYYRVAAVNEQGVDLQQYAPFSEGTKAVRLTKPASFRITSNVPYLDGATALYPLYSAFAQATYPPGGYRETGEIVCTNTRKAYRHLIHGQADIIFVARPSRAQREEAEQRGVRLNLTPIGREAFVFFVNSRNPVTGLTTEQVKGIYEGRITNWNEVGGSNQRIRAFQRPEDSGSQTMLEKIMEGRKIVEPPKDGVAGGMGEIIEKAADYRNFENAIGFSFLYFATRMVQNKQIRLLKIDGVYPDRESIRRKTYAFTTDFYAATAGSKNPNVDPFIRWILSPEGQYLVEKTGYTSINGQTSAAVR